MESGSGGELDELVKPLFPKGVLTELRSNFFI
jgi:hypothetical protein